MLTALLLIESKVSVKCWVSMNPEGAMDISWRWRERNWRTVSWSGGVVSKGEGGAGGGELFCAAAVALDRISSAARRSSLGLLL